MTCFASVRLTCRSCSAQKAPQNKRQHIRSREEMNPFNAQKNDATRIASGERPHQSASSGQLWPFNSSAIDGIAPSRATSICSGTVCVLPSGADFHPIPMPMIYKAVALSRKPRLMAVLQVVKRRARESNPQSVARHLISSCPARCSTIVHLRPSRTRLRTSGED